MYQAVTKQTKLSITLCQELYVLVSWRPLSSSSVTREVCFGSSIETWGALWQYSQGVLRLLQWSDSSPCLTTTKSSMLICTKFLLYPPPLTVPQCYSSFTDCPDIFNLLARWDSHLDAKQPCFRASGYIVAQNMLDAWSHLGLHNRNMKYCLIQCSQQESTFCDFDKIMYHHHRHVFAEVTM